MPPRSTVKLIAGCGTIAALIAGAAGLQWLREQRHPASAIAEPVLYVTSGRTLQRSTVGYTALAADLYWIRALQYYGGTKLRLANASEPADPQSVQFAGNVPASLKNVDQSTPAAVNAYPLLYPMLELTTTLDPLFNVAYRFGAIFLTEPFPGGAGRPDLAIALLEKGLQAKPDKWEYMQDAGFVNYWWRQDYKTAAGWFDRAGQVPGAPWWLKSLAAGTLADGGDRRASRLMWNAIREAAEIDWLRNDAERRLTQFDALDQIDRLQEVLDRASAGAGAPITDWSPLVRAKMLPGLPADPSGTPYEIDNGRVIVSQKSPLMPMPREPQSLGPLS